MVASRALLRVTVVGIIFSCGGPAREIARRPPVPVIGPLPPSPRPEATRVVRIRTGPYNSCAVTDREELICWGPGDGRVAPRRSFSKILDVGQSSPPAGKFVDVALGTAHGCGLEPDGRVRCWGHGGDLEVCYTDGTTAPGLTGQPGDLQWTECPTGWPPFKFVAIEASDDGNLGMTSDGGVIGWGAIWRRGWPTPPYVAISASRSMGERVDVCALRSTGGTDCLLGSYHVALADNVESISVGYLTCGLAKKRLICWDTETWKRTLGSGVPVAKVIPPRVLTAPELGLPDVDYAQVSCGAEACCARTLDGQILCARINPNRETIMDGAVPPQGNGYIDLSVSAQHACAVTALGKVTCWGINSAGQCDVPERIRAEDAPSIPSQDVPPPSGLR